MREKRRDFELHLLPRGSKRDLFSFGQLYLVAPGINLDASAERQCRDLVEFLFVQSRSAGQQR